MGKSLGDKIVIVIAPAVVARDWSRPRRVCSRVIDPTLKTAIASRRNHSFAEKLEGDGE